MNFTHKYSPSVTPRKALLCASSLIAMGMSACSGETPTEPATTVAVETEIPAVVNENTVQKNLLDCPIKIGKDCSNRLATDAVNLRSRIGTVQGNSRVASPGTAKGFLSFGPYATLKAGKYDFTLNYNLDAPTDLNRKDMDSYSIIGVSGEESTIFSKGQLSPSISTLNLDMEFAEDVEKVQFRVFYNGRSTLLVDSVIIEAKT